MESVAEQSPAAERKPWQFKPGQSGNPHGRKPKTPEQRALEAVTRRTVDQHLERRLGPAFKALDDALKAGIDADAALRLKAALRVIEYAAGTPVATSIVKASIEDSSGVQRLSPEQISEAARVFLLRQGASSAAEAQEPTE